MEEIKITFTKEIGDKIEAALCSRFQYQEKIPDESINLDERTEENNIDNPETKQEFIEKIIKKFINDNIKAHEIQEAVKTAKDSITDTFI